MKQTDQFWNTLTFKRTKTRYTFILKLPNNDYKSVRSLWYHKVSKRWEVDTSKLFVRRNEARHRFNKFSWYGFNDKMLQLLDNDCKIILKVEEYDIKRMITVWEALEVWKYLTFSAKGLETQVFVPFSNFSLHI